MPLRLTLGAAALVPARPPSQREVVVRDSAGRPFAYGWRLGGSHWLEFPGLVTFHFREGSDEVHGVAAPGVRAELLGEAYERTALPLALQTLGLCEALHASAVLAPGSGVLAFCGVSGAGKTTLAAAFAGRGYELWADDAVAFEQDSHGAIVSTRLPFTPHERSGAAGRGAVTAAPPDGGAPGTAPLAAVCLLEAPGGDETAPAIERLPPAAALAAVLPHSYRMSVQSPERKRRMTASYLDLVERLPVLRLRYRRRLEELDGLLDAIERALRGPGR